MSGIKLYWVYDSPIYEDIFKSRINVGYCMVDEVIYDNEVEYALALNGINDLKNRLNKELVFTDMRLAYKYMVAKNSEINENILQACL